MGYFWLPLVREAVPYVLAASAASFIYIAVADLIPTLRTRMASSAIQFILILSGVATIALLHGEH
jgi:zinc and cadmium transporter